MLRQKIIIRLVGQTVVFGAFLLAFSGAAFSQTGAWKSNVNLILGAKSLDTDDWAPVESQSEYGISIEMKKEGWPLSAAIDILVSGDKQDNDGGISTEAYTSEIDIGVKKIWDVSKRFHPYIGGGFGTISAELTTKLANVKVDDEDSSVGYWFSGGMYMTFWNIMNAGFEARYSSAKVTIGSVDGDAGGAHYGIILGIKL